MSWNRSTSPRARLRQAAQYHIEGLERRLLLSSAIAAFATQQTFATGSNPRSVAVADVNTDGKLDLLVANSVSNTAGVMLGNGNGTFQSQQTFTVGTTPFSVAVADVNADGKLDLITANNGSNNVSLLLGNGNGTFQAQKPFGAGVNPRYVAVADVNGDGKPDLLVANYNSAGSGSVSVLLGNGNGTFSNQQTFSAGTKPSSIAVGDFNADGKLDLAVVNKGSNNVSVLLGNGNGTFQTQQLFSVGTAPFSIAAGDLNQDGKLDLVTADESSNAVSVLLGNGNGTFQAHQTFATGTIPCSVAVSDINGDGKLDVVAANYSSNNASVLLGNGNGSFQSQKTFATGTNPFGLTIADMNRDGRQDLLVANEGSNNVSELLGDVPPTVLSINRGNPPGPTTSDGSVNYTVMFNEPVTGVDSTDFALALSGVTTTLPIMVSGSGAIYTVTINGVSGDGTLGLNLVDDGSIKDAAANPLQPGGTVPFQVGQTYSIVGLRPTYATLSDVNADGKPDLIVSSFDQNGSLGVLLGNGNGTFQDTKTFTDARYPHDFVVSDLNGDGKPDLIVRNGGGNYAVASVLLGNGNGTFGAAQTLASGSFTNSLALADINKDGKQDIIIGGADGPYVMILLGNGNGTFQAPQTLATGADPGAAIPSDVNGDGNVDLIVTGGVNCTVLLGNGNGTFRAGQSFSVGAFPTFVALADVNRDGKTDLVVAHDAGLTSSSTVGVLIGNGNGSFQSEQTFAAGVHARALAVSDVNGDGKPDAVVVNYLPNYATGTASVLLGNGNGSFQPLKSFPAGQNPISVAISDVNADGRVDLAVANNAGVGTVSLIPASFNANLTGQLYTIVPSLGTISGSAGVDQITLAQDPDHIHIDWTLGTTTAQSTISDPNGLTINGNGSNDIITLDYTNGNPLPNLLKLDGTFTVNGLTGSNPLAGQSWDINRGVVFVAYPGADPVATIRGYLKNGYNSGAWNGSPTASTGVITSSASAQDASQKAAVGYADSADGVVIGLPPNTIEIAYAFYGDINLDGSVNSTDLDRFNQSNPQSSGGAWGNGDFNYDGSINAVDFNLLMRNYYPGPAAELVKDIDPGTLPARTDFDVAPLWAQTAGPYTYFAADDGIHGQELWRTDGTAAGTNLVIDLNPGPNNSSPQPLLAVGNVLYFGAYTATSNQWALFRTDGTAAGTQFLADLGNGSFNASMAAAGGKLFIYNNGFYNGVSIASLMVSDGTQFGTQIIVNGASGFINGMFGGPGNLCYFSEGNDLWKTDGTKAGTVDIYPNLYPSGVVVLSNQTVVLTPGRLYRTDGTTAGTTLIANAGIDYPQSPTVIGSQLYFASSDGFALQPWVSDGTASGTKQLKSINSDSRATVGSFVGLNGNVYFRLSTLTGGSLWRADAIQGAVQVTSLVNPGPLTVAGSLIYFSASDPAAGNELWKSDGTATGTARVADIIPGPTSADPTALTAQGNKILFWCDDRLYGQEVHMSDGTAAGTGILKDINALPNSTRFGDFGSSTTLTVGNSLFFTADDYVSNVGLELWKTDGTAGGTTLLKDINPGPSGSVIGGFVSFNNDLYFILSAPLPSGVIQQYLWRSDGTASGTVQFATLPANFTSSLSAVAGGKWYVGGFGSGGGLYVSDGNTVTQVNPTNGSITNAMYPTVLNDTLYFLGTGGIWKTDGTPNGTTALGAPPDNSSIRSLNNAKGRLFFVTDTGLWVMDPDGGNLTKLTTIAGIDSTGLVSVGTAVFFRNPGANQLIGSNGTTAGTFQRGFNTLSQLTAVGDTLYFEAGGIIQQGEDYTPQVWKSDGTLTGTVQVSHIAYSNVPSNDIGPMRLFNANGTAVFSFNDGTHGRELWETDGTAAGTFMFDDINPGSASSNPQPLGVLGRSIYFAATEPTHGNELWRAGIIADAVSASAGPGGVTIVQDADHQHIDWTAGSFGGQLPIAWPAGLTITGDNSNDAVTFDYSGGNPLPSTLHLNGTFTINALSGSNPLANTTLEIGRSTVYISYSSSDPLSLIQGYLRNGFNNGAWNGGPTASTGVITSTPAAANPLQTTAIGYADSADGLIPGQPANTIELKYTLYGDTTLTGTVGSANFTTLTQHYHQTTGGTWDTGDFNYDGSINFNDFTLLTRTYNTSLGNQAVPGVQASSVTATPGTWTTTNSGTQKPTVQTKPASSVVQHHKPAPKHPKKHRR